MDLLIRHPPHSYPSRHRGLVLPDPRDPERIFGVVEKSRGWTDIGSPTGSVSQSCLPEQGQGCPTPPDPTRRRQRYRHTTDLETSSLPSSVLSASSLVPPEPPPRSLSPLPPLGDEHHTSGVPSHRGTDDGGTDTTTSTPTSRRAFGGRTATGTGLLRPSHGFSGAYATESRSGTDRGVVVGWRTRSRTSSVGSRECKPPRPPRVGDPPNKHRDSPPYPDV